MKPIEPAELPNVLDGMNRAGPPGMFTSDKATGKWRPPAVCSNCHSAGTGVMVQDARGLWLCEGCDAAA
ncbi:MAG: hypothetical protein QOF11_1641 [Chloroflexota bacterium]|jgi:hypothetical protein|nr:hypothetical protein [Chloroflexota bacterium]